MKWIEVTMIAQFPPGEFKGNGRQQRRRGMGQEDSRSGKASMIS
jgi:hypothetical protein